MSITTNRPLALTPYGTAGAVALCGLALLCSSASLAASGSDRSRHRAVAHSSGPTAAATAVKPITTPVLLSYGYKAGDVRRYKVEAYFTGHFPPFATAGSPPIHLMIVLRYLATVKSVTDKGAEVDFNVEDASLSLLEKEPAEGAKVNPKDVAEFPVPLSQVQKMFNATATLKPNGSITKIQGGDTSSVKIDLGIDLRKLFLVTAPTILADKPVKIGDEWPFADGLLGANPGKTTYTGRLQAIGGAGKSVSATLVQQADATVDGKLDKEGNSTSDNAASVGSLVGKVTLTGTSQLVGTADSTAAGAGAAGRVTTAKMAMVANLKRTLPDPEKAGQQLVTDIDIKARLYVTPTQKPAETPSTTKQAASETDSARPKKAVTAKAAKHD